MKTKIAAAAFLLFVVLIILAADSGHMPDFLRRLYDFPGGDRVGHVILYGILAFLLASAFPRPLKIARKSIPIVSVALLIFAAAEECSQALFSTRTPDLIDLLCSGLGVCLGSWIASRRGKPRSD